MDEISQLAVRLTNPSTLDSEPLGAAMVGSRGPGPGPQRPPRNGLPSKVRNPGETFFRHGVYQPEPRPLNPNPSTLCTSEWPSSQGTLQSEEGIPSHLFRAFTRTRIWPCSFSVCHFCSTADQLRPSSPRKRASDTVSPHSAPQRRRIPTHALTLPL